MTKRRFKFRFGLRTLLLSFLVTAPLAGYFGNQLYERELELKTIQLFADASGEQFRLVRGGDLEPISFK